MRALQLNFCAIFRLVERIARGGRSEPRAPLQNLRSLLPRRDFLRGEINL
jgi:hypothetical protein